MRLRGRKTSLETPVSVKKLGILLQANESISSEEDESDDELKQLAVKVGQAMTNTTTAEPSSPAVGSSSHKHTNKINKSPRKTELENFGFVIDRKPGSHKLEVPHDNSDGIGSKDTEVESGDDSETEQGNIVASGSTTSHNTEKSTSASKKKKKHKKNKNKNKKDKLGLSSSLQVRMTSDIYVNVDSYKNPKPHNPSMEKMLLKNSGDKQLLKKSILQSDLEKKDTLPTYEQSLNQQRKERKKEKELTKGRGWFDMPAQELTEERKNDLMVLQMRRALDPKRFYKAPDIRDLPKYYQMGRVVESAADFYHSRVPKKQRKATLVEELLADAEFRKFNKRKYEEIAETKKKKVPTATLR